MSGSEKESEWNRSARKKNFVSAKDIKLVTREFHFVVVQKKNTDRCTSKVCCTCQVFFFRLLDLLTFFFPFSLPSPLSIARFYFWVSKTTSIVTRASLLALAKSIYYCDVLKLQRKRN